MRNNRKHKNGMRAALLSALMTAAWMMLCAVTSFAESSGSGTKQGYTPMHMAIILDSSGSVGSSKETLLNSRSGAACLASSVPLRENKVAVFSYSDRANDEAKHLIRDGRLQPVIGLTAVSQYEERSKVISELNNMRSCSGGTALVYAVRDAAAYLKQNSDPNAKDVIVIFTDGEETEALSNSLIKANPDLIDETVREALEGSDARVYSIAYDHNGSITGADGGEGYGYQLLKRFEELSGGRVYDTGKISDLPKCFDEIIGEVCCLPFDDNNRLNLKADGGEHEKVIHVPPCVAEATIRISCGALNIIRDGKVMLFDEKGENVQLNTKGSESQKVWYTVDDLGATIKLRAPGAGDWKLRVSDMISDQDIRETWIMQYNMSVEFMPDENAEYHIGDTVPVKVILKSDGETVTDPEIYQTETDKNGLALHANLVCSDGRALPADFGNPKSDEMLNKLMQLPNAKSIPLKQASPSDAFFTAEVPVEAEGSKLLSVWIDSAYFYCYIDKTFTVGEKIPDALTFEDVTLENGQTVECDLIPESEQGQYTGWEIVSGTSDIAEAAKDGFTLKLTGKKEGEFRIRLHFDKKEGASPRDSEFLVRVVNSSPKVSKNIPEAIITLEKGETKTLSGVNSWFEDYENDALTISVNNNSDKAVAGVTLDGDTLKIEGKDEGSAKIRLLASDGTTNAEHLLTVNVTLSAAGKVMKWLPWIIGAVVLLAVILILMAIAAKKKRRLFITLKKAVYAECDKDGNKQNVWTLVSDMKLNAKLDCGEMTLGKLMQKLAGMSMDPAVQNLAMAGASHRFAETCGIADTVNCIGGKDASVGVRFAGKSKSLMADGQIPGEAVEMRLRTDPGGNLGLIVRLSSGELTQIWLCTKENSAGIDFTAKGQAAAKAWEKLTQQEQPEGESTEAAAPAEQQKTGGWQSGEAKAEPAAEEKPAGGTEQKASAWGSGTSGSSWGSGASGNAGGSKPGSSWGSGGSSGNAGGSASGSSWGSGASGNAGGSKPGSSWGSGGSSGNSGGGSSGSSWGSGNSGRKW